MTSKISKKKKVNTTKDITDAIKLLLANGFGVRGRKELAKLTKEKETIPDAGHFIFVVAANRFAVYTVIGADNIHHASNKATKLFGDRWSSVRPQSNHVSVRLAQEEYTFMPSKLFRELLNP